MTKKSYTLDTRITIIVDPESTYYLSTDLVAAIFQVIEKHKGYGAGGLNLKEITNETN